jgi:hypothetical protein
LKEIENRLAASQIIHELRRAGFAIESLDELRRSREPYTAAVPILLKWLPLADRYDVKEAIVRALSVPWARPSAAPLLVEQFRKTP